MPPPRNTTASRLTSNSRRASEKRCSFSGGAQRPVRSSRRRTPRFAAADVARGDASPFLVPVADTVERLDLREIRIDGFQLLAQPLDVAVDGPVIDEDVLAVGCIHQLVTILHMSRACCERFEDEELGHRQLD